MGNFKLFSVDRIEENYVVLQDDDGKTFDVEIALFSFDVKRGDLVYPVDEGFQVDIEETERKKKEVIDLQNKLLKKRKTK